MRTGEFKTGRVPLDRSEQAILDRLREEAERWRQSKQRTERLAARRDLLVEKARRCGIPLRVIEKYAGISNPAIVQNTKRGTWKRAMPQSGSSAT